MPSNDEILAEAKALHGAGRLREAEPIYRRFLQLRPDHLDACLQLANLLARTSRFGEAAAFYRQALLIVPAHPGVLGNLGSMLRELGQLGDATACFRQAAALAPASPIAQNNLGVALMDQEQVAEAIACFDRAVALETDYPDAYANRATAMLMLNRLDDALTHCEQALKLDPTHPAARHNLAFALLQQRKPEEALASCNRSIEITPDHAESHLNRALIQLSLGRFAEGWEEYEWRWKCPGKWERSLAQPRWNGSSLAGKTILLWTEQGLGDALQFIRYARLVKQRGATVIVECKAPLAALFARSPDIDQVVVQGQQLPPFDVHSPLLSLPLPCGTTREDLIPAHVPYLAPDEESIARWRKELSGERSFKVGIAWRGAPTNLLDRRRSIPLAEFGGLARTSGVRLYSLQFGSGGEELTRIAGAWPLADLGDRLGDFHNTAAIMRNLDLVITCDSSPAHLAGALGVPVWVALALVPDWRWLHDRDDSPWYPTMRLFRQSLAGNWESAFRPIEAELARRVANFRR